MQSVLNSHKISFREPKIIKFKQKLSVLLAKTPKNGLNLPHPLNKTLSFSPINIILGSLKAELSELNNHVSKFYVSPIQVA